MNIFKNFSFKTKLILLCIFMSVVSLTTGSIGYEGLHEVAGVYGRITGQVMPKLEEANEMKGFAVVAEEVGNLAQMSGNAAKEISDMLDGSVQKVEGIVNETKIKVEALAVKGKSKVETGIKVAQHCGEILNEIVSNVSSMAGEISSASQEQSIYYKYVAKNEK